MEDDNNNNNSNKNDTITTHLPRRQMVAHLAFTNAKTERIVAENLHLSRHVREEVVGPRYCPSIEAKVQRFPGREHQVRVNADWRWSVNATVLQSRPRCSDFPAEHQVS